MGGFLPVHDRVRLRRMIPFVKNAFKPIYIGEFREINARVVPKGQFTMHGWAKAFMTFWLGFCRLSTVLAIVLLWVRDPNSGWFPFAGMGMFTAGVAFVALCKRIARNDAPWLSKVIQDALSKETPNHRFQSDAPQAVRA